LVQKEKLERLVKKREREREREKKCYIAKSLLGEHLLPTKVGGLDDSMLTTPLDIQKRKGEWSFMNMF